MRTLIPAVAVFLVCCATASAQHRVLVQGNGRLAMVESDGAISWEMPWGETHDLHILDNGHIMALRRAREIVEINPATKQAVWSYDAGAQNGNEGRPIEVHAFQPLPGGAVMIAESGPARIIEIDRDGKLLKAVPLTVENPNPHRDTRLARKLANGNYLVCHEGDGAIREYDGVTGAVVWEFRVPLFGQEPKPGHGPEAFGNQAFSALRLANGNTLVGTGNGHSVIEVTPAKDIVWELHRDDLPGVTLAWVTTVDVLPNGNLVFGNCHAGPGQPLLIEIERASRKAAWTLDRFDDFGNSVSNTVLADLAGKSSQ